MAVLLTYPCSNDFKTPTSRIGNFIAQTLGVPFIHNKETLQLYKDKYDVLFTVYGHLLFCKYREELLELYNNAEHIVHIENDHAFKVDPRFGRDNIRRWTTVVRNATGKNDEWINWNRLTWRNGYWEHNPEYTKKGLVYYGAYRPDRVRIFKQYMLDNLPYNMHIVGYPRNIKKFKAIAPTLNVYSAFDQVEQLRAFQAALYIQDTFNDQNYGCPANRFYEMLYCGIPMIFDSRCAGTFETASQTEAVTYDIRPYMVSSPQEIPDLLCKSIRIKNEQHERWYKDYSVALKTDFIDICKKANFIK
jgi:hypothetical protein